jgi:signal transduction histidine kinase
VNYARVTPELLLFGFVLREESLTPAQSKAKRLNPRSVVGREVVEKTVLQLRTENSLFQAAHEKALQRAVTEYKQEAMFRTDLLELLKPEIKKSLSFLHDYKQFVARVKQHINVVIQTHYPNCPPDIQLANALPSEKAIYHSAALMEDKIETALLLTQPERLGNARRSKFGLHGFILKHLRIYQVAFDEKDIKVVHAGHSYGMIVAPQAFAAIPHTLLDNALKYSQRGSEVVVGFKEDKDWIEFSVTSYGPKIESNESQAIFELFRRGAAAATQREEGSGIGLYLAQFVARDLGTQITVNQSDKKRSDGFETKFSIRLKRADTTTSSGAPPPNS